MIVSTAVPSSNAEQRAAFKRRELRDCAGVTFGVASGAFVWLVLLSLAHGRL